MYSQDANGSKGIDIWPHHQYNCDVIKLCYTDTEALYAQQFI